LRARSDAESLYDNIYPVERFRHIARIKRVTPALFKIGIGYSDSVGTPGECADLVSARQTLVYGLEPDSPASADYKNV